MKFRKFPFFVCLLFVLNSCAKDDAQPAATTDEDDCFVVNSASSGTVIPNQYIIVYKPAQQRNSTAARLGEVTRDVLEENGIVGNAMRSAFNGAVEGFVATLSSTEAARLSTDDQIERVEPDRVVALSTCFTIVAPTLITWNVNKVGYGNGIGKTAWVIDTGIDLDHPDLTVDSSRGRSFISTEPSTNDENGHGTHVAGIIGARNNDFGVLGVASGCKLVPLKVLNKEGKGTLSAVIQALAFVSANGKAGDVVNMSLGEDVVSASLDQQVQATAARGIFLALAAGNDAKAANLFSPGRTNGDNIYTVSAVDSLGNFATFSNFGNDVVDYAAPGVRILSTYKDGKYAKMSGTSMATPHVAVLLLLNSGNMHYSGFAVNDPDGTPDKIALK